MDLESLFGSRGRVKVLKFLLEEGYSNITRIVRETGLSYRTVVRHLEELKKAGLVEERRYGRLRVFEVDLSNPRLGAIRELIRELERL
ncbi:MAG: winged helix-turn-helix domain-containing protein [Desulfurococcales archaeon]|nr:winged helix-turn-helix domain-containing protein [Desulfurococcales archaeon]